MHPILIKIGSLQIPTYGFLLATGVLLAIVYVLLAGKRAGLNKDLLNDLLFYTLLAGVIGGKLFLLLTNLNYYLTFPSEWKYLLLSGGSYHGGLIFGTLFFLLFIKKKQLSLAKIGDIFAPAIALAHFFGRLGCFSAGCCFGRPAGENFCSVTFHNPEAHELTGVPLNIPLYPTQLLEAVLNLLNFIILTIIYRRSKSSGTAFSFYFINYGIIRFFLEYLRGDSDRGYIFGSLEKPLQSLSVPQLISILLIVLGIIFLKKMRQHDLKNNAQG